MKGTYMRIIVMTILLLGVVTARADIYRCVDETGQVVFTQQPCAPHQDGEKVDLEGMDTARTSNPQVCRDVKKLAGIIFPHIATTESVLDVYANLGGREYLSAGVTAAVNYVFNFRYNPKAKQDEVVELTYSKCLDGGFGRITEKDLPNWANIKYLKDKAKNAEETQTPDPERIKHCEHYGEKISELTDKMEKAKDKSEKLQAQVDKEYYEGLKKDQCSSIHPGAMNKAQENK